MSLTALPDEVIGRIFDFLGFRQGTVLDGSRLWPSELSKTAMSLGLTNRANLKIFSSKIRTVDMDRRHHFGSGRDEEIATLLAIVAGNLDRLTLSAVNKAVGERTTRAIATHCPNLSYLCLADLPSVSSKNIAAVIERTGRKLRVLSLRSMYAGDDVLNSIATHCDKLTDLHLIDLHEEISSRPLQIALCRVASTIVDIRIVKIVGRGLSTQALLPACNLNWPALKTIHLLDLGWLAGPDPASLLVALGQNTTTVETMKLSITFPVRSTILPIDKIRLIQQHFRDFACRADGSYGFDNSRGAHASASAS